MSNEINLLLQIQELPENVQRYMEAVWFADHMTSALPHEEPGRKMNSKELLAYSATRPSDDVVGNVWTARAVHEFPGADSLASIPAVLPIARKDFLEFVEPYVCAHPEQWGYAVPGLLKAEPEQADWLAINHRGCGTAMRAGALAVAGEHNMARAAMLLGISHLHPDAIAGGFAVWQAMLAAGEQGSWADIEAAAYDGAEQGDHIAHQLHQVLGLPEMPPSELAQGLIETLQHENPYELVSESRDFISARYVTSTALMVAKKKFKDKDPIMSSIQLAAKLGGDPDTIAVISCGLMQQRYPDQVQELLQKAYDEFKLPAWAGSNS